MNNKYIFILLVFISLFMIIGCKDNNDNNSNKDIKVKEKEEVTNMVKAIINKEEYIINLEDNETAREFVKMLPEKFGMSELNGNEKYVYLDNSLCKHMQQ